MSSHRLATLSALWLLAGCAAQSFEPTFKTPERPLPEQIAKQLASVPVRAGERAVIVAVTHEPKRLIAWDLAALDKGALWEVSTDARSAPLIAGNAVVVQEGDAVSVRDLSTGKLRASLGKGARLVGADGEGDAVVITLAHAEGSSARGTVAYVDGARVRFSQDLTLAVGSPALARGYVIVPWATHRLSVLDSKNGAELARFHFNGAVLGHARVHGDGVYVGQHGLLRITPELLAAKAESPPMIAPKPRPLPSQPPFLADGYAPIPEPENATHHLRLDFGIEAGALLGDALYQRFYRLVIGMKASDDELRFVSVLPRDVVGAQAVAGGLLVTDEGGSVRFIDESGQPRVLAELGVPLHVASLRGKGLAVSSAPQAPAAEPAQPAAPTAAPEPLAAQLYAAAKLDDSRLAEARAYAVDRLALTLTAEVTAQLVEICIDGAHPESVRRMACTKLEGRGEGGDAVLAALKNAKGPNARTSALAKAAASMRLRAAAALLLPRVLDPRTDPSELAVLIEALAELGHAPAAQPIERFLRLHHAEPDRSELLPALQAATAALATLRAKRERATLAFVAQDGLSAEPLRKSATEALARLDAPQKPATAPAPVEVAAEPPKPAPDPRPRYLSSELIDATLRPVRSQLEKCLHAAPDDPKSARIAMVVGPQGSVESAFVTPGLLQACLETPVLAQRFPETQKGRQNVTYVVHRPDPSATKEKKKSARK